MTDAALFVRARQPNPVRRKQIFWGLTCLGVTAACLALVPSLRNFYELSHVIPVATAILVGVVLLASAGRPKPELITLARFDLDQGMVLIHGHVAPQMDGEPRTVWLDEISSIVFGMTRHPVGNRPGVTMEAFTLCLHLFDGSVVPIVEASPKKLELYQIGKTLSELTHAPLQQAGLGA